MRIIVLLLLFTSFRVFAQSDSSKVSDPHLFVSYSPQYLVVNGLSIDLEKKFKNSKSAIIIGPKFYVSRFDNYSSFWSNSATNLDLMGLGLELTHKFYLNDGFAKISNWYAAYSFSYQYFDFSYDDFGWLSFENNGVTFFRTEFMNQNLIVQQYSGSAVIGAMHKLDERIFIDTYFGLGLKFSDSKNSTESNNLEEDFRNGFVNYAYTGTILKLGMRLGVIF